jgi:hypothetical protein
VYGGCSREFEEPPQQVVLEAIWPASGFTGDALALCATNLDQESARNLVSLGSVSAGEAEFAVPSDWMAPDPADFSCDRDPLFVRVPVLPAEGPVAVQVENATGLSILPGAFFYRGPGHPVSERIQKQLHLRAGLWSVFAPPGIPAPAYGAVSREADMISIFEPNVGLHLDFGQCALPLSGAVAMTEIVIDIANPENWEAKFKIFGVTGQAETGAGPGQDQFFDLNMWAWDVDLKALLYERKLDPPAEVPMPDLDGEPFRPFMVWAFTRPADPLLHDIVVSHVSQPALAVFPVESPGNPVVVRVSDQEPYCQSGSGNSLGPISGLVHDPVAQVFYVSFYYNNEIWRVSLDGQIRERAWPPPIPLAYQDQIDCSWFSSAVALRRSHTDPQHLRLYVADRGSARVRAMRPETTALGTEILTPVPLQQVSLDGLPYALTTGRFATQNDNGADITGEHLYAATQNGLVIIDVTAYSPVLPGLHAFRRIGEIPVPSNQGGPQSLITSDNFGILGTPDTVVFADAHNDLVRFYAAGEEEFTLADITIGATVPQLASSYRGDRLFLTDALSNSIQVIDRNSGLREGQFPIAALDDHALMGFGSTGMTTLRGSDYDLLLMPLLDLTIEHAGTGFEEGLSLRYENIAFGRYGDQLPDCSLATTGMSVETAVTEEFHQMHLVTWDWQDRSAVPVLVLNRMHDVVNLVDENGQITGEQVVYEPRTWCLEVDPDRPPDSLLAGSAQPLCDLGPDSGLSNLPRLVQPARRAPAIARLEEVNAPGEESSFLLRLLVLDGEGTLATEGMQTSIGSDLTAYITGLQVLRGGSLDHPVYVAYLPLSYLGGVLAVTFDPENGDIRHELLETGGTPLLLYASPDGRRAYVTHPLEGRVDTLRLACDPDGACDTLATTLDVGPFPYQVEFDDTGRYAFVIHLFSNDITVIE